MNSMIATIDAPSAIGPYSQAVVAGDMLFVSGQLPIDVETGGISGNAAAQTTKALSNALAVVHAAGFDIEDVATITVFIVDMQDFGAINKAYADVLGPHRPARVVVGVKELPKNAKVEIKLVARR